MTALQRQVGLLAEQLQTMGETMSGIRSDVDDAASQVQLANLRAEAETAVRAVQGRLKVIEEERRATAGGAGDGGQGIFLIDTRTNVPPRTSQPRRARHSRSGAERSNRT